MGQVAGWVVIIIVVVALLAGALAPSGYKAVVGPEQTAKAEEQPQITAQPQTTAPSAQDQKLDKLLGVVVRMEADSIKFRESVEARLDKLENIQPEAVEGLRREDAQAALTTLKALNIQRLVAGIDSDGQFQLKTLMANDEKLPDGFYWYSAEILRKISESKGDGRCKVKIVRGEVVDLVE